MGGGIYSVTMAPTAESPSPANTAAGSGGSLTVQVRGRVPRPPSPRQSPYLLQDAQARLRHISPKIAASIEQVAPRDAVNTPRITSPAPSAPDACSLPSPARDGWPNVPAAWRQEDQLAWSQFSGALQSFDTGPGHFDVATSSALLARAGGIGLCL